MDWEHVGYGTVHNDDGSRGNERAFRVVDGALLVSDTTEGHLNPYECSSEGVSAHLTATDFFADGDIRASFTVSIVGSDAGEGFEPTTTAFGFAFRFVDAHHHYRFEWHQDGCMSIVRRSGSVAPFFQSEILASKKYGSMPYAVGDHHEVEVLAHGSHIGVSVDGDVVLEVDDTAYGPDAGMGAAFYVSGNLRMVIDDFVVVDAAAESQLASWKPLPADPSVSSTVKPCAALATSQCYSEAFQRTSLSPESFPSWLDGPADRIESYEELPQGGFWTTDADKQIAKESSGFGYQDPLVDDPCLGMHGSILELKGAEQVVSPTQLIRFRMKLSDPFGGGIGVMFRYQKRLAGFRDSERYYRYSWGRGLGIVPDEDDYLEELNEESGPSSGHAVAAGIERSCEGVYRFEEGAFTELTAASPDRTPRFKSDTWYDISVFISEEAIEVSRDGVMIGKVHQEEGGLSLAYGSVALWCGGHTSSSHCAFDDLLVVDRASVHHIWAAFDRSSELPRPPLSPIVPRSPFVTGVFEGFRLWSQAKRAGRQPECLAPGQHHLQPVVFELGPSGMLTIVAPEVTFDLDGHTYTIPAQDQRAMVTSYEESSNRLTYVVPRSSWVGDRDLFAGVDELSVCLRWRATGGATGDSVAVAWDGHGCRVDDGDCGFTAELHRLGEYSSVLPPVLEVTKPEDSEVWVVGTTQSRVIVEGHKFLTRPRLRATFVYDGDERVDWDVPHSAWKWDDDAIWSTGRFRAALKNEVVSDKWFLGYNEIVVSVDGDESVAMCLNSSVFIECPLCQAGRTRGRGETCKASCKDPKGCEEDRCMGTLKCKGLLAGWQDETGYCMMYADDVRTLCTTEGRCAELSDTQYCYSRQVPVLKQTCASDKCRRESACQPNQKAKKVKHLADLCHFTGQTNHCGGDKHCVNEGACVAEDDMPGFVEETPAPPTPAPPVDEPTPAPPVHDHEHDGGAGGGSHQRPSAPGQPLLPRGCDDCRVTFGKVGGPLWCQCCAYDCDGFRGDCVSQNGFCDTRCVDDEAGDRYCWWKDGEATSHAVAPPPPPPPPPPQPAAPTSPPVAPGKPYDNPHIPQGETPIGGPPTAVKGLPTPAPTTRQAGSGAVSDSAGGARDRPAGKSSSSSSSGSAVWVLLTIALLGGGSYWYWRRYYRAPTKAPELTV